MKLLAALLLAVPLAAQDLAVVLDADQASAYTGDRISGSIRVINSGVEVPAPRLRFFVGPRQQEVAISGPNGWTCAPMDDHLVIECTAQSIAAEVQASFSFTLRTRNDLTSPVVVVSALIVSGASDPDPADNESTVRVPLVQHPATAALSLQWTAPQNPVPPGTPAVLTLNVKNGGPDTANGVRVEFLSGVAGRAERIDAPGWTCTESRLCRRTAIAAGQSAPIVITYATPSETTVQPFAFAGAELSFDPDGADNEATIVVGIGEAERWHRTLLPVALLTALGANESLWATEVTGFIDSDTPIALQPFLCNRFTCQAPQPSKRPFNLLGWGVGRPNMLPASFVYTRVEETDRLTLNVRIRDLMRTADTWGTEVPAVRESEFRTSTITLMPLPVDPLFRTTLRVYDRDARPGATVAIHVYADDEDAPRATLVRTLATTPATATTALLPWNPGYLQLDPIGESGDAMAGAKTAWIRVEPLTPGLRFWAFASVTNNPTGHVTTLTPQ